MTNWLSVDEWLPELTTAQRKDWALGVQVIVAIEDGQVFPAYFGTRWCSPAWFYLHGAVVDGVTDWQPMPEHPNNEGEGS